MNEYSDLVTGKELVVRKKVSSFIEKTFRYLGYDFRHDIYKKIIYGEDSVKTSLEEKIKSYYDAYLFLISNHKNPFTKELLNKFFYLLDMELPNQSLLSNLTTKFFCYLNLTPLEAAINFHLYAYQEMKCFKEDKRYFISLMFFNFMLLKFNIPTIRFTRKNYLNYNKVKEEYFLGNKTSIYNFFLELITNFKFQDKHYYQKLKPLAMRDIYNQFDFDKEMLINEYDIKHLSIYGSFSKGDQRIDSDIDVLISFNLDLTREQKLKNIDYLSKYYFDKFYRYIDILELGERINDELIKETTDIINIF